MGQGLHRRPPEWTTRLRHSGETIEAEEEWIALREAQRVARRKAATQAADPESPMPVVPPMTTITLSASMRSPSV